MQNGRSASGWRNAACILVPLILLMSGCGPSDRLAIETVSEPVIIAPVDFALLPCGPGDKAHPCVLIVAGGKRVLIGAPAGVASGLSGSDLGQLDALMLFSLRAVDIEGVDEVRNASWQAGRKEALMVAGPAGTETFVQAMNQAYETSDALAYVAHEARGGFDSAVLRAQNVTYGALDIVMDTGDLQITGVEFPPGRVSYFVNYAGSNLVVSTCGGNDAEDLRFRFGLPLGRELVCEGEDLTWPLPEKPVFIIGPSAKGGAEAG